MDMLVLGCCLLQLGVTIAACGSYTSHNAAQIQPLPVL